MDSFLGWYGMALVVKSLFLDYLVTKGAINFRYSLREYGKIPSYLKLIAPLVTHLLIHFHTVISG